MSGPEGEQRGPRVSALYRYPVKGLSPEPLARASLIAGDALPFDRAYAIENGSGRFDPAAPRHLPKTNFLMLMRNERLASVQRTFEHETETLTLVRNGEAVARGRLATAPGRRLIEEFVAAYLADDLRGAPKIVRAPGHSFSDTAAKCVHIVNLASLRELERALGHAVHPLRFRANLYLDGIEPWSEFNWLDRSIRAGSARLAVFTRTHRCEATNVDPATGRRDMTIPAALMRRWGHADFGVYARVEGSGEIGEGAPVQAPSP